ncbi:PREDICTED: piggyBac transposable element-derived protein 4-like [Dinoponera quadriceps]|uniref:PiggyBac transposable element-derived protein 4-like n=1 Tax=Dinoponera quadriceps TaxID=609295 RepID=A0A6P3XKD2_DINQU|nr:PREDICTED: piggyBac transposable element-derived protein 4-like [Dinoponera quadriceps]
MENFVSLEESYCEIERQNAENEEDSFSSDSCSENEDEILHNDDIQDDEFSVDEEDDMSISSDDVLNSSYEPLEDERKFFLGKDMETIWTNLPLYPKAAKTLQQNIISHLPRPNAAACGLTQENDIFSLFITDEMINIIVEFTNAKIRKKSTKYASKQWYIAPTDPIEIKALLGLLYMGGVLKDSDLRTADMFSNRYGPPIFRCVMSKNRFEFLLRCLRFDDKRTRQARKSTDSFAPFREFWDMFNDNCKTYYTPSDYLTVDEIILGFRERCPFKLFQPQKPDEYGMKIISMCDAKTFYFCSGIPYIGCKKRGKNDLLDPTQYVLSLTEPIKNSDRNVTVDNWFMSYELAQEMQERRLTVVGSLRKDKPQIPPMMLKIRQETSKFLYDDNNVLISFIPKKNKNTIVLSTMHSSGMIDEDGKPEVILFYNMTKGGVDMVDKLCQHKSTKRQTRRWTLRYFYSVLDLAALNSYVIFKLNKKFAQFSGTVRTDFLKYLAYSLAEPQAKRRLEARNLSHSIRLSIIEFLGIKENVAHTWDAPADSWDSSVPSIEKLGRCNVCKISKIHKDRKGRSFCTICRQSLCGEHKRIVCPNCLEII